MFAPRTWIEGSFDSDTFSPFSKSILEVVRCLVDPYESYWQIGSHKHWQSRRVTSNSLLYWIQWLGMNNVSYYYYFSKYIDADESKMDGLTTQMSLTCSSNHSQSSLPIAGSWLSFLTEPTRAQGMRYYPTKDHSSVTKRFPNSWLVPCHLNFFLPVKYQPITAWERREVRHTGTNAVVPHNIRGQLSAVNIEGHTSIDCWKLLRLRYKSLSIGPVHLMSEFEYGSVTINIYPGAPRSIQFLDRRSVAQSP